MQELKGYDFKNMVSAEARRGEIVDRIIGWMCFIGIVVLIGTDIVDRVFVG